MSLLIDEMKNVQDFFKNIENRVGRKFGARLLKSLKIEEGIDKLKTHRELLLFYGSKN